MVDSTPNTLRVAVGLIQSGPYFLMSQHRASGPFAGLWEFPGGKCEPGEVIDDTLHRELQEELGIELLEAHLLTQLDFSYPHGRIVLHVYNIAAYRSEPQACEAQTLAWYTAETIASLDCVPSTGPIMQALAASGQTLTETER